MNAQNENLVNENEKTNIEPSIDDSLVNLSIEELQALCIVLQKENENLKDEISQLQNLAQNQNDILKEIIDLNSEMKIKIEDQNLKLESVFSEREKTYKRHQDEIEKIKKFGIQKFATQMLNIKDYIHMSISDNSENINTIKEGLKMTVNELDRTFHSFGVQKINTRVGDPFDPEYEEAISILSNEKLPKNTILSIEKVGYTLFGRVIIPSKVIVSG